MPLDDCIRFMASAEDRHLLQEIAHLEGDIGLSAVLRRLIRAEAKRRGVALKSSPSRAPRTLARPQEPTP